MKLEINNKTSSFISLSQKSYNENEYVKLGKQVYNFEIVKDCKYIGTILTNKNKLRLETEKRITNANGVYYALFPLLKRPSVLRAEKVKICKTTNRTTGNIRSRISDNE